jgi:uncharacterized protein YjeT (DUF2065 family)
VADFLTGLGLALVLEGLVYALFPDGMRRAMMQILSLPGSTIRVFGALAIALGVAVVWAVRGTGLL